MVRQKKRAKSKRAGIEIKLIVFGCMLSVLPYFISQPAIQPAFKQLQPLGLLLLAIGAVMALVMRALASRRVPNLEAPQQTAPRARRTRKSAPQVPPTGPTLATTIVADVAAAAPAMPSKPDAWGHDVFKAIEWRRFEAVVEALFAQAGFETKSQSHGADGGVDVWLYSKNMPGQPVSIVQCKRWQGKAVGVDKVRELRGVMASHHIKRGQFATTSTFTPDALAFAKDNGVNLLDIAGLLALIAKRTPEQQAALLAVATEGEYWRPTCVNCGIKLIERQGKEGRQFWGCANYPRCRATMVISAA